MFPFFGTVESLNRSDKEMRQGVVSGYSCLALVINVAGDVIVINLQKSKQRKNMRKRRSKEVTDVSRQDAWSKRRIGEGDRKRSERRIHDGAVNSGNIQKDEIFICLLKQTDVKTNR